MDLSRGYIIFPSLVILKKTRGAETPLIFLFNNRILHRRGRGGQIYPHQDILGIGENRLGSLNSLTRRNHHHKYSRNPGGQNRVCTFESPLLIYLTLIV